MIKPNSPEYFQALRRAVAMAEQYRKDGLYGCGQREQRERFADLDELRELANAVEVAAAEHANRGGR